MSSVLSGEGSSTHKVSTEEMLMGMGLIVASQVGWVFMNTLCVGVCTGVARMQGCVGTAVRVVW